MARKSKNRSRNLNIHNKKGLFAVADKAFSAKGIYADDVLDVDEIWLVFDTEIEMRVKWKENWNIVKKLRKKCKNAIVKMYMTKGCIEYYFLLHYEKTQPLIATVQDKENLLKRLSTKDHCSTYKKAIRIPYGRLQKDMKQPLKMGSGV